MKEINLIKPMLFSIVYVLIGIVIINAYPNSLLPRDSWNYIMLTSAYFVVAGTLLVTYMQKGLDIFEPIVLITFLYLMIFCITPILNIVINETLVLGVDVMDGCIKATLIFLVSYFAFYIGYYFLQKRSTYHKNKIIDKPLDDKQKQFICRVSLIMWVVCYTCLLLYIMSSGKNLMYILSIGMTGNGDLNELTETPIGFLAIFGYSLIPTLLYICVYSNNKFLKILLGILTLSSYLISGFRFIIIILLFSPVFYFYLKNNKRPKIITLMILLSITVLMIGVVGFMRDDVRTGAAVDWSELDANLIIDAVKGNFDIYMPFYGLVNAVPSLHDYTFGQQSLYTVIMFIPRAIWPDKPTPIMKELIEVSVSDYAVTAGVAWPNLGEFYSEFGIVGSIIGMFIFGKICGWCKTLYQNPNRSDHTLIAYSIVLPACMQLVIRGYSPSNFYLMLFLLLPIIVIKGLVEKPDIKYSRSEWI